MKGKVLNWLGGFLHNCVGHPMMQFLPPKYGDQFHDWTIDVWDKLKGL